MNLWADFFIQRKRPQMSLGHQSLEITHEGAGMTLSLYVLLASFINQMKSHSFTLRTNRYHIFFYGDKLRIKFALHCQKSNFANNIKEGYCRADTENKFKHLRST